MSKLTAAQCNSRVAAPVRLSPDLCQTYHLTAPLAELSPGVHPGKFSDDFSRTHPGAYRWHPRNSILTASRLTPSKRPASNKWARIRQ